MVVAAAAPPALLTSTDTFTHSSARHGDRADASHGRPSEAQRAAWLAAAAPLVAQMCAKRGWGQDAPDLAQDVLVATWRAQHNDTAGLDSAESVRKYAAAIAGRVTPASFASKRSVSAELLSEFDPESGQTKVPERVFADYGTDPEQTAADHARADAATARVEQLTRSLTPRQRQLVAALRDGDRPMTEIAAELGISPGGANTTKRQALDRMRVAAGAADTPDPGQMPSGPVAAHAEAAARAFLVEHGRLPEGRELAAAAGVGTTTAGRVVRALHQQQGSDPTEHTPHGVALGAGREFLAERGRLPGPRELARTAGVGSGAARHALSQLRVEHPGAAEKDTTRPSPAVNQARVVALSIHRAEGRWPTLHELQAAAGVGIHSASNALQALKHQPLPEHGHDAAPARTDATAATAAEPEPAASSGVSGEGERAGWLRDTEPLVRAMCAARLPAGRVDDAVQAVMEATWRAQHTEGKTLDDPTAVRRYAASVAKVIEPARDRRSAPTVPSDRLAEHPAPDHGLGDGDRAERVAALLGVLSPRERQVMVASEYGARDTSEVAAQLGITESGVRSAQVRAMARLRQAAGTRSPNPLASGRPETERARDRYTARTHGEQAGRLPDGPVAERAAAEARRFHGEHGRFPSRAELVARTHAGAGTAQTVLHALHTTADTTSADTADRADERQGRRDIEYGGRDQQQERDGLEERARAHRDEHGDWPSASALSRDTGVGIGDAGAVIRGLREREPDPADHRDGHVPSTPDVAARVAVAEAAAAHHATAREHADAHDGAEQQRTEQLTRWHTDDHPSGAQRTDAQEDGDSDGGDAVDERGHDTGPTA